MPPVPRPERPADDEAKNDGPDSPETPASPSGDESDSSTPTPSPQAPTPPEPVVKPDSAPEGGQALYEALSPIPNPAGGAHQVGERFLAGPDDARVKSRYAKRVEDSGDDAPAEVASALDASSGT